MEFEWDLRKEAENIRKHGVSFITAIGTFNDPAAFAIKDIKHSGEELRYYWVGKIEEGRILTTRYTRRGDRIRLFGSAEWREFRKLYYEKTKTE